MDNESHFKKNLFNQRSNIMKKVRSKGTKPEMIVRRLVHSMGYRYRLHQRDLPGKPDLVFPSRRKIIFVHGCFWHGHNCPSGLNRPKSNFDYWIPKLQRNVERDLENQDALSNLGWKILILWECELRKVEYIENKISKFLDA